jgi:hypothetical protein
MRQQPVANIVTQRSQTQELGLLICNQLPATETVHGEDELLHLMQDAQRMFESGVNRRRVYEMSYAKLPNPPKPLQKRAVEQEHLAGL